MTTKKDFNAAAAIFAAVMENIKYLSSDEHRAIARLTTATVAEKFAEQFARDNPRFDRARFLAACGIK